MTIHTQNSKKKKEIVIWFGRANPTTQSHVIGFHTVLKTAEEKKCPYVIYLSTTRTKDTNGTVESSKLMNPLSGKSKIKYCRKAVPQAKFTLASKKNKTNSLYEVVAYNAKKYHTIHIVAGPDRKATIEEVKAYYAADCTVKHIESVGRQFVHPDSGEVVDVRATKLRTAIFELDFKVAVEYMPLSLTTEEKWALYYDTLVESGRLRGYDEHMTKKVLPH